MAVQFKPWSSSVRHVSLISAIALLVGGFVFVSPAQAATPVEEGKAIFEQKCSGCHSIGGGRTVGPDLNGITGVRDADWLVRFISAPDRVIAQGDPIAKQIVREYGLPMPNVGVTGDEARMILAYLDAQSSSSPGGPTGGASGALVSSNVSLQTGAVGPGGDANRGRNLFTGKLSLKNGGPSCASCHNVSGIGVLGGGSMGKDLTASQSLMGDAGLLSIMKTAPFPIMKEVYTARPLIDTEASDITAFLGSGLIVPGGPAHNPWLFVASGVIGAVVIIGVYQLRWRGRLSGVRRPFVKGVSK